MMAESHDDPNHFTPIHQEKRPSLKAFMDYQASHINEDSKLDRICHHSLQRLEEEKDRVSDKSPFDSPLEASTPDDASPFSFQCEEEVLDETD